MEKGEIHAKMNPTKGVRGGVRCNCLSDCYLFFTTTLITVILFMACCISVLVVLIIVGAWCYTKMFCRAPRVGDFRGFCLRFGFGFGIF